MLPNHSIICAADLNVNIKVQTNNRAAVLINQFMSSFNLTVCTSVLSKKADIVDYTYCHESLNHHSCIDFILVSNNIVNKITEREKRRKRWRT